ncbi:hypothetical protein [Clostridium sp. Marseille-Q2269]|uniref:hypothetical protein n=1 Tax=Clostridium sp. Marseille-Q2269 TaxID=2942205 RepID=UPI0020736510|nr:hypothetical protein [Clostridium sp. Marseille-Q2269]
MRIFKKENKLGSIGIPPILILVILLFILIIINFGKNLAFNNKLYASKLQENIYNSMNIKGNRVQALSRAIKLNNGSSSNTCVYFISEVLRMNGENIHDGICNTTQLLDVMKDNGWKIERDYRKLRPGDICFTTDDKLNKNGTPTHTYVFMKWAKEDNYDYAYVCDNQAKDYDGKIYHLRNIKKVDNIKGNIKDPFSFFMYKK